MTGIVMSCVEPLEIDTAKNYEQPVGLAAEELQMLNNGQVILNCI